MSYDISKALYWDIESHRVNEWDQISPAMQKAFIGHYYDAQSYDTPADHYAEIAGLYAEFSHVICVVFGFVNPADNQFVTFESHGKNELEILNFCRKVFDAYEKAGYFLVDFNGSTCDRPYMAKRYVINRQSVPSMINEMGLKPWEKNNVDFMDEWKLGDYKRTSLEMVCASLGVECKTDKIGGDNLYQYNIDEMPWDQLVHYCTMDVESMYKAYKIFHEFI